MPDSLLTGTAASPGTALGPARIITALDGFARFGAGDVLVCRATSPAWTPLLARASAAVTETGGVLSHAAIVAREYGIPAVLAVRDATSILRDGQTVRVDGSSGQVTADAMSHQTPTDVLTLHAVRILGYADTAQVAARFRLSPGVAGEHLLDAHAHGWIVRSSYADEGGWSLTEAGKARNEQMLATELDETGARHVVEQVYQDFLPHNTAVSEACTAWQLAEMDIGDGQVGIEEILARLARSANAVGGLQARLASHLPRFAGYHERFASAVDLARTDPTWVTATDRDSCHRVWFELHEDLIATLGLTR